MLFNSHVFIFFYLPIVLACFFWIGRLSHLLAAGWLAMASVFFYGWWNPLYVPLLLASIAFNYMFGVVIAGASVGGAQRKRTRALVIAIGANLLLLGYYKYANFFLVTANTLAGADLALARIVLPLGISFFTFTQIAFLVDVYQGKASEPRFVHYCLFVTYFPHLIAGPVLHHKEMMPQFREASTYTPNYASLSVGFTIFAIGLFKKVVVADGIAPYASMAFDAGAAGGTVTFFEAWGGALCYALQIYFDFSGYSDMAIGLSRLFNIVLPLNFHSPYRAASIIEFWRCWHMTLSRFLRDYLYVPLGGNRYGRFRRYRNLMATMLLGGLWHGAGWTFVAWGGLHGVFLVINHAWRACRVWLGHDLAHSTRMGRFLGRLLTFATVVVAWVFFRAENFDTALAMLSGMAGANGVALPAAWIVKLGAAGQWLARVGVSAGDVVAADTIKALRWALPLVLICWFAPNTQELMRAFRPALNFDPAGAARRLQWQPALVWAVGIGTLAAYAILRMSGNSEFLYFQF
jgi:alginate O-acetyltransferase complex protein AlgI